jgi:hypothetical protein
MQMRSIAREIQNSKQGGREQTPVKVTKQKEANYGGMDVPGEGTVVSPPHAKPDSAKAYADAVGAHFGSKA